jgi:hypothetical protein
VNPFMFRVITCLQCATKTITPTRGRIAPFLRGEEDGMLSVVDPADNAVRRRNCEMQKSCNSVL